MKFTVTEPSRRLRRIIEGEPRYRCFRKHEGCAVARADGPCTAEPCTCESYGWCLSCVPREFTEPPGLTTR